MIARSEKVNTSYFHFLFRANVMQEMIGLEKMAGAQDAINQDFISHLKILVPPTEEQRNIADYLNNETSRIQNLIGRITDSIMKLQEYRDSLISEAVTGKIDVRQEA
jgi:type I restriction enzyme S subunit